MPEYFYLIDTNNRGDLIEEVLKRRLWWKGLKKTWTTIQENQWNFLWKTTVNFTPNFKGFNFQSLKPYMTEEGVNLFNLRFLKGKFPKLINHFPYPDVITRKTNLVRALGSKTEFLPETYILNFEDGPDKFLKNYKDGEIWILKPEYQHSGKGIEMFDSLEGIVNYFEKEIKELENLKSPTPSGEWVIQKYIKNPFLIDGRKFDIRINVLVTKNFDIYVSPHGFIRTISEKYVPYLSGDSKKDKLIHITNHSVQKYSKNYGLREEGNVMSLNQFQTYLDLAYGKNVLNVYRDFFPQWIKIIQDVILTGLKTSPNTKLYKNIEFFEMFGFDFLIDDIGKSWLLEVNTNPGLEQDNSWAIHTVRDMLEELAKICIDPVFPSPKKEYKSSGTLPPKNLWWEKEIPRAILPKNFTNSELNTNLKNYSKVSWIKV